MAIRATACFALLVTLGCGRPARNSAIDPGLAACVPPGAIAVAGVQIESVRGSPWLARLRDLLGASPLFDRTRFALAAWNGREYVVAARGNFTAPLQGVLLADSGLALMGNWSSPARTQYARREPGEPQLLERAEPLARQWPLWVVFTGGRSLPLHGNAANLNRLLRATEFATVAARPADGLDLEAAGHAATGAGATRLEETLRALITLTGSTGRDPEIARLLQGLQLTRADRVVTVKLHAPASLAARMLDSVIPAGATEPLK